MSYILEALKKSQQERELGKVPTLDMTGLFEEDTLEPPTNRWPLIATGLAGAAVLIALYAALRAPVPGSLTESSGTGAAARPATETRLELPAAPAPLPARARVDPVPVPIAAPPIGPLDASLAPEVEPLVEPPPPRRSTQSKRTEPVGRIDPPIDQPIRHPDLSALSEGDAEIELQRQLESELAMASQEEAGPLNPPTPVPRDLIADIEAFKQEVAKARGEPAPAKVPAPSPGDGDPTKLRLTPEQEADLPPFVMTVHVYDADKDRRFVLISGRKYREGDKTRQGVKVERILADGAVLSFKGNPFFVHR